MKNQPWSSSQCSMGNTLYFPLFLFFSMDITVPNLKWDFNGIFHFYVTIITKEFKENSFNQFQLVFCVLVAVNSSYTQIHFLAKKIVHGTTRLLNYSTQISYISRYKGASTSVRECEQGMRDWGKCERMRKSRLFSIRYTSERASVPLVIHWLTEWMYVHISTIANVFFFKVPTLDGQHLPVRRTYATKANEGECYSLTSSHYAFCVRFRVCFVFAYRCGRGLLLSIRWTIEELKFQPRILIGKDQIFELDFHRF